MQEQDILVSDNKQLRLTTKRVVIDGKGRPGGRTYISIPLHKVSACVVRTRRYPSLLWIAAAFFLVAAWIYFSGQDPELTVGPVMFGVLFLGAYAYLRSGLLEIVSDGARTISVPTKGMAHEDVIRFGEALAQQLAQFMPRG